MEILNFRNTSFQVHRSQLNHPAQLIICHGICEHSLRYLPIIKKLNKAGFDCAIIDNPGHGQQVLQESFDEDFLNYYDSLEQDLEKASHKILDFKDSVKARTFQKNFLKKNKQLSVNDVIDYQKEFYSFLFREKIFNRSQKTFIMGQSMGGLVASSLAPEYDEISGTILLSPAFKAQAKPAMKNSKIDLLRLKVEKNIINMSDESFSNTTFFKSAFLKPLLAFNPSSDCSWACNYISDIAEINEIFSKDPFIGRKVSLKFLHSIQQQMKKQRELKGNFSCPVFIEFGMEDKIINSAGCLQFIENRLHDSSHFFKSLNGFEPHEIHNSKRQNYLINDIQEWCSRLS